MAHDPGSYSKGYNAGRKKTDEEMAEIRRHLSEQARENAAFRRAVFLAVLPGIIEEPWQTNGKTHTTAEEMVRTAANIADEAMRKMCK